MKKEIDMSNPLLSVGVFGTHLLKNPGENSRFSFFGEVPLALQGKSYDTYEDGMLGFIEFFKALNVDDQREMVGDLRNDVFEALFNTGI